MVTTQILVGMAAIAEYAHVSRNKATQLIKFEGLPATREGGTWVSSTSLIDDWRTERIREATRARQTPPETSANEKTASL